MTKTEQLLKSLCVQINALHIAGYLKEEVIASLRYLHRYKLKNLEKNLNIFFEYLLFLNTQNTEKIDNLQPSPIQRKNTMTSLEIDYFIKPKKQLTQTAKKYYSKKIRDHGYELLPLIQGIKGIIVLSIDAFCNASQTRMGIHKLLMEREPQYQELKTKKSINKPLSGKRKIKKSIKK